MGRRHRRGAGRSDAAKSLGLALIVGGVLVALGGLVEINAIWLRGPFDDFTVASPAHPDWYLLWVTGALRIFPAWEPEPFGYLLPNPFFPAVLLPLATFAALYAWPFVESRITGDRRPHHLLDRPGDHPMRTAVGVSATTFLVTLVIAGMNDKIAIVLAADVFAVNRGLQVAVLALPPVAGLLALLACRRARGRRDAETAIGQAQADEPVGRWD